MVRHNNVIPNQHFKKKWERRYTTWFDQPAQKKARAAKRKVKAAAISPRPAAGALRPVVHCPTKKYCGKVKFGRGFTLEELKEAGIPAKFAQTIGISVDHRRTNKSNESLNLNVERLKEYKNRLIIFPRKGTKAKKGDSSKEDRADAQQLKGPIIPLPKVTDAITSAPLTDEMKEFRAHSALRVARNDAHLLGVRTKKANSAKKDGDAPAAKGGDAGGDE